mgnify:CR=1 FL=1
MKKVYGLIITLLISTSSFASPILNETAKQYVQLVLALGNHDAAYVDAYYGPEYLLKISKKNPMGLDKIIAVSKLLQEVLAREKSDDEMVGLRISYLKTQLNALTAKAQMLTGDSDFDFDQESKALYDTQAPKIELAEFEKTLTKLEKILPGDDALSERVEEFKSQFVIPQDKLKIVFDAAIKACRERTKPFVELLENENFTLEFVKDKPWSGYNWYKGKAFSLIQVNIELPIDISRAVDLGCHEGYPGHHTYNSLLESNLYIKRGWIEYSVYPLYSPQSLIAEGSANYGIEMAFPGNEKLEFEKKVLYPLAGLNPDSAAQYKQVTQMLSKLNYAGNEVARLYRNKKIDAEKAQKMLQKYALMSAKKAKQRVRFIDTYGAYVINYNWGKDMVKQWVEAGDDQSKKGRWKRFAKLLSTPRLPSTLN